MIHHKLIGHNHVTRDIKPPGQCPVCDEYHERNGLMSYKSIIEELDGLIDSLDEHVTYEDVGLALGELRANVFEMSKAEKAQAPADDEREAITDEALCDFAGDLLDAWNIEDTNAPSMSEYFRDRFVARFHPAYHAEPQGEPSDAQVLEALRAYWGDDLEWNDWSTIHHEGMRAALRAAGKIRLRSPEDGAN